MTLKIQIVSVMMVIALLTTAAYCSTNRKANFELTGQVLDYDTKEPIAGAYVLAVYEKVDLGMAGASRYCVKTKGMLSDSEGQFHFPIDKLDGNSPHMVYAIKADYFLKDWALPTPSANQAQTKQAYTGRHVYLKRQQVGNFKAGYTYGLCRRPESRQAVEANIEFIKIEKQESIRLGKAEANVIKNFDEGIRLLEESIPENPKTKK